MASLGLLGWSGRVAVLGALDRLPLIERLSDGSFRSEIHASEKRRRREHGMPVRVIEYAIDDLGRAAGKTR